MTQCAVKGKADRQNRAMFMMYVHDLLPILFVPQYAFSCKSLGTKVGCLKMFMSAVSVVCVEKSVTLEYLQTKMNAG